VQAAKDVSFRLAHTSKAARGRRTPHRAGRRSDREVGLSEERIQEGHGDAVPLLFEMRDFLLR
jgi:hypothetical protein